MANPVAVVDDLVARWRPLTDAETLTAQALLDDAWAITNAQVPSLAGALEAGTASEGAVRAAICSMVLRVLRNPEGWVQEAVDDWSGRRAEALAAGVLYLSDVELAQIGAAIGQRRRGAFSIAPQPEPPARSPGAEWPYVGYINPHSRW